MNFAIVNHSTEPTITHAVLVQIASAVSYQLSHDYVSLWGGVPAAFSVTVAASDNAVPKGTVIVALMDRLDAAGALGYHDVAPNGSPYVVIGVRAVLDSGGTLTTGANSISACISHECLETAQDADCNVWTDMPDGRHEDARELADRTEGDSYTIQGIAVSNFLGPHAFGNESGVKYDFLGLLKSPWEIRPAGYAIRRVGGPRGRAVSVWGESYPEWKKAQKPLKSRARKRGIGLVRRGKIRAALATRQGQAAIKLAVLALFVLGLWVWSARK